MRSSQTLTALFAAIFALFVLGGCSGDTAGALTCTFDTDCALGTVCQVQDRVCITAGCEFCPPGNASDQICYKPTPDAVGSCSAPQCSTNAECAEGTCRGGVCTTGGCVAHADCGDGEICNLVGQCAMSDGTCAGNADCPNGQVCKADLCVDGCATNTECKDDEFCTSDNTCAQGCRDSMMCPSGQVCTEGDCGCTATSCPDGKVCLDTGNCGNATDCSQLDCGAQVCDPATLMCVDACTADSCLPNEVCNAANGRCEINNCPGEDPNQCAGNAQRPVWDPIKCFCAECLDDTTCDQGAGETCNAAGNCFSCQTVCDPATPGTCQGTTPYCISNCCVECVGAADCAQGQLCLDGFCGQPPNCQVDPSVCPAGYTCSAAGQCESPQGGACSANDPASCPAGTFCDPTTLMCSGAGGGMGCGLCNPDCTCDGGLTCNGFLCEGCSNNPFDPKPCPNGDTCLDPFAPICFPF